MNNKKKLSNKTKLPPANGRTAPKGRATPPRPSKKPAGTQTISMVLIGAVVALLVTAVVGISILTSGGADGNTDADTWDLPALSDTGDADGTGRVTLAQYEGTPLVVNFFASWCTSCEAELPRFDAAAGLTEGDVAFVFVNSNETGNWRPMAERTGIDDRVLVKDINGNGGNGLYFSLGGSGGMPMTAFYAPDGTLLHVDRGELSTSLLASRLADLYGVDLAA